MKKEGLRALKRPDYFQEKFFSMVDWATANRVRVITIGVSVVLVGASLVSWNLITRHRAEQRLETLAAIDKAVNDAEKVANEARTKLRREINVLDTRQKLVKDQELATVTASLAAKQEELKNFKADTKATLDQYLTFYNAHKDTNEGQRAGISAVQELLQNKSFEQAATILGEVLNHAPKSSFYSVQVRSMYIEVLQELGRFEPALAEADRLVASATKDLKSRALLVKSQVQMAAGHKDLALKTLDEVIGQHHDSAESFKARALKAVWN